MMSEVHRSFSHIIQEHKKHKSQRLLVALIFDGFDPKIDRDFESDTCRFVKIFIFLKVSFELRPRHLRK